MKRHLIYAVASLALVFSACGNDDSDSAPENTAPTCRISAPVNGKVHQAGSPLIIQGLGQDEEDGTSLKVTLTVGDDVIEEVSTVPFEYSYATENLEKGPLTILLRVEDSGGLSAEDKVEVTIEKEDELIFDENGNSSLAAGYWTEEHELRVAVEGKWTISIPSGTSWIEVYDEKSSQWAQTSFVNGEGATTVRVRTRANELFTEKTVTLKITAGTQASSFDVKQAASPDMLMKIEDEMLRMAASTSVVIYEMDPDEDGKISAYEAELEPEEDKPYGFDAGSWDVVTTKGIENFPHLKHLDVNRCERLTEIDLSGNPDLMSIHVEFCSALKTLDLSKVPDLIELGCNYDLYLSVKPELDKMKDQIHTLGILNRTSDLSSDMDFSGYTGLSRLYVYDNHLTSLNLSGCTSLWLLSASGNDFTELDLSDVDRIPDNMYIMTGCPNLKKIYVWKGFTEDYYYMFNYDKENGVEIIEKE